MASGDAVSDELPKGEGSLWSEGGTIALVKAGDTIVIDIPNRTIALAVSDAELGRRHATMKARGQ